MGGGNNDWTVDNFPTQGDMGQIARVYNKLRQECAKFEKTIENANSLSEKDLKRLDKAVTVMKAGFKIAKKAIKQKRKTDHGLRVVA